MNRNYLLVGALVVIIALIGTAQSAVFITDNTAVAVPTQNGTSTMLNVTARMQQYVGFFGDVNMTVRLNVTTGNVLYNKLVTSGKIYFYQAGDTPTGAIVPALNNSQTDGNFSLTGYYVTGNHFISNGTICGTASVDFLNTTDNYGVGIFRDSVPNYFLCTDIVRKTSSNGFGTTAFEVVVPKTSSYTSYDVYLDLE